MILLYFIHICTIAKLTTGYDQCQGDYCPDFLKPPSFEVPAGTDSLFLGRDVDSGCLCREFPDILTVCFGRNSCTSLPIRLNITSPRFTLGETLVPNLKPGDFQQLTHLQDLQLRGNSKLINILPGTFKNMSLVMNLSISYCPNLNSLHPESFVGLVNLKHLYLTKNGFQNVALITQSLKVNILPNLLRLVADSNRFSNISENDFKLLSESKIRELSLGLCRIEFFHPKALNPLKNLEKLQLPENRINVVVLNKLLEESINNKIDLKMLNIQWLSSEPVIPKDLLEIIAKSNVSILNLAKNHFEELNKNSFPYFSKLEVLDLRDVLLLSISDDAFENLPNLKILLLSSNKLVGVPNGALRPSLTYLDLQENSGGPIFNYFFVFNNRQFSCMQNLTYLNLAYNNIPHLFNNSFVGLKYLKTLVLKNLSLFHVEKFTFSPLKNLEYLDMEHNTINHGNEVPDIFFPLRELKTLKLGGCQFKSISVKNNPFRNLRALQRLELRNNLFTSFSSMTFQPLVSLKYIDLQKNYLTLWNESLFYSNKNLKQIILDKNKIPVLNSAMLQDFLNVEVVNLDVNGLLCNCFVTTLALGHVKSNVSVLKNILKPNVLCTYPEDLSNVTLSQYYEDVQMGKILCKTKFNRFLTFLPLIITIIILIFTVGLAIYFRWQIRYLFFLTKLYLSRKGKIKSKDSNQGYDNYIYDAFVSYCSEDTNFVFELGKTLENHPPYFKLCVYDRDFLAGVCISDAILVSIERSKKTLLIISDNYVKSHWCRWESHIAEHHRISLGKETSGYVDDSLILIKIGMINKNHLTPLLRYLLKTRVYLEWSNDEHKQKIFFEKLRNAFGQPIVRNEMSMALFA